MKSIPATLTFLSYWGWLQIGPYIHINIDPVILHIGPLALHWYGVMYVVAIVVGLWCIRRYTAWKGIRGDQVYRMLWWCLVAGLVGGRLYYVIQKRARRHMKQLTQIREETNKRWGKAKLLRALAASDCCFHAKVEASKALASRSWHLL